MYCRRSGYVDGLGTVIEELNMKNEMIFCSIENDIATITIDIPPVNALNSDAMGELYEILYKLRKVKDLKVVILTAMGKFFAAGSDVKEFLEYDGTSGPEYTKRNDFVRHYLYTFPQPVICALNGGAIGGGLGLSLMCDMRITHSEAKFGVGEINMGILSFPQFLAMRISNGNARKMVYTGSLISAEEALNVGLVDEIVEKDQVYQRALELAENMAKKSPKALQYAKQCMLIADEPYLHGLDRENEFVFKLWDGEDHIEAVKAFLEKRDPHFTGK